MRLRGWTAGGLAGATLCVAGLGGAALSAPVAQATPSTPTAAYGVIGTISATVDQLAIVAGDDTVYGSSWGNSTLVTIAPGTTSGVPVSTLALPARAAGVAVDSDDDSVYTFGGWPNKDVWVSRGGSALDDTISLPLTISRVAVNSADDTIYATGAYLYGDDSFIAINGNNTDDSVQRLGVGFGAYGLGVDQVDDTVWVGGMSSNSLRMVQGSTLDVVSVPGSYVAPRDLVVSGVDHVAYVSTSVGSTPTLQKVSATGALGTWSDPVATNMIMSLSLNADGSRVAFSTGTNDEWLWLIDTATLALDGLTYLPQIADTAQADSGLIYVARNTGNAVNVVAKVQGSLSTSTAQVGDTITITLSPTPATAAGQPVEVDDSTIAGLDLGGTYAPVTHTGVNTFSFTAPSGPVGTVEVLATLAGGSAFSLGNLTYSSAPTPSPSPEPPTSASAPREVTAVAGDGGATVAWLAPAAPGSFPVTNYQVTSSPGGRTCVTSALSCEVDGLMNGTSYTFTVKALTGAGWSAASDPSSAVTPQASPVPTIVITGARDGRRIEVTGTTSGMAMGAILTPWVRTAGRSAFARSSVQVVVSMDGTFTWGRKTGKKTYVYMETTDGSVRSNLVVIPAR